MMRRRLYLLASALSCVMLLVMGLTGSLSFRPLYPLAVLTVFCLYCYRRERSPGPAWFFPVALWLVAAWWDFSATVMMPRIALLDYSRLAIEDPAGEVERARVTLKLLPLIPLVGYLYAARAGLMEILSGHPAGERAVLTLSLKRLLLWQRPGTRVTSKKRVVNKFREHSLRKLGLDEPKEDIVICYSQSGEAVKISDQDRYMHTLVVGPTGVGKTSRVLKPMVELEIKNIRRSLVRGIPRGLTVIEPKGDFAADVAEMARYYNVPLIYIDPLKMDTCKFNPLEGEPIIVAETTRTVLQATFGRQEAFYAKVQEVAARNMVLLLKYSRRNDVTLHHMSQLLRNHALLREEVNGLKELMDDLDVHINRVESAGDLREREWFRYLKSVEPRIQELIAYFDIEVLSEKIGQKIQQFALGLRLQVDDIAGNEYLGRVIGSRSDINLDAHLNRGGVLVVNTAMGHLGKLGDTFGQFLIMHFQNAVFRRTGNEFTRARHMLIMDEAHRYINPDFERLLAMGRGFRCECVLALQNTAQLSLDEKRSFRESVLNLCRNKIIFGGMDYNEARFFAGEFGELKTKTVQKQYAANLLYRQPWKDLRYREVDNVFEQRFDYTKLIEMPAFHVVYRIVKDGRALPPGIGVTRLSEWDRSLKESSDTLRSGLLVRNEEVLAVAPSGNGHASTDTDVRL